MDTSTSPSRDRLSEAKRALLEKRLKGLAGPIKKKNIITRRGGGPVHPMAYAQERLWFLDQMEPGSPFYNIPVASLVSADLDVPTLERALSEIVRRHEAIRTVFRLVDGEPKQIVVDPYEIRIEVEDIRGPNGEPATEKEVRRRTSEEGARPFDLQNGPLFRAKLFRVSEEDYAQVLTMHHIVTDGWSMPIVTRELEQLYEAFYNGEPSPLEPLEIQFPDYSAWQREFLTGDTLKKQVDYWREHLEGAPNLELPTDRPRPPVQTYNGNIYRFFYPGSLLEKLKALGKEENSSLNMVVMAGFNLMLHKYSGQDDIVVGTLVGNRNHAEVESLVGFFVNSAAVRMRISPEEMTFRDMIHAARTAVLDADANQDLPFDKIVDELHVERDLSRNPVFQVMYFHHTFVKSHHHLEDSAMASRLNIRSLFAETGVSLVDTNKSKFDMTIATLEMSGGMPSMVEYNSDLFDESTIERMVRHMRILMEHAVERPDAPISELLMLDDAERAHLLEELNDTERPFPADSTVVERFERMAAEHADAEAVVFGDARLTYGELNARANRLAHRIRALGVEPGQCVGVCIPRSADTVVALLGAVKAGAVALPLDPDHPADRLAFMVEDSGAPVVVTLDALRGDLPGGVETISLDGDAAALEAESAEDPAPAAGPDDAAYAIYTSGSTGRPKGALIPHRAILRTVVDPDYVDLGPDDRIGQVANTSFDASIFEIWGALLNGARLVGVDRDTALDPAAFERLVSEQGVTVLLLTTQLFNQIARERPEAFAGMRYVLFGGEAADAGAVRRVLRDGAPEALINAYGPTEATVFAAVERIEEVDEEATTVPIGRPISNTRVYVLDPAGQPVGTGVPGELYVGGPGVALGYLNRPELTAAAFVPDPFSDDPSSRLYRTGDRVRWLDDGRLDFLGRVDNQVKIRGFRIELGEIENALEAHDSVAEALVVAREEGATRRLVGYVVAPSGAEAPDGEALRAFLRETLPDYMVPSAFVTLEALPLTPHGKVDHRALPAPTVGAEEERGDVAGARDETEALLVEVWSEVLGVGRVGIHDNFFELGGDSILSIQIIARLGERGVRVTPKQMFQYQTVAELAPVAGTAAVVEAEQRAVVGPVPLSPVQRWFFEQDVPEPEHFNMAVALEANEPLDAERLEKALAAVLEHHDALRMRFTRDASGAWRQRNTEPAGEAPLERVDVSGADDLGAALTREAERLHGSLDLAAGPVVRLALLDAGEGRPQRLLLVAHHLVTDAVSLNLIVGDLMAAYVQLGEGHKARFPAKTTSFKRWAERLDDYVRSGALDGELPFWVDEATGPAAALPRDRADAAGTEGTAERVATHLDEEATRALLHDVPGVYGTKINEVLLAALLRAFAGWTGESSLRIDLEGHGREDLFETVDLSRTVGWFTAIHPVRLSAGDVRDSATLIKDVKEHLRSVPNNGIGYGILRYLGADGEGVRALRESADPEVAFNYLGQHDGGDDHADDAVRPVLDADLGAMRSDATPRRHLLNLDSLVAGGQLHVTWTFSPEVHDRATVEKVAEGYLQALRELIEHCKDPEAGGFTPSDFPEAGIDQATLDALMSQLGGD